MKTKKVTKTPKYEWKKRLASFVKWAKNHPVVARTAPRTREEARIQEIRLLAKAKFDETLRETK